MVFFLMLDCGFLIQSRLIMVDDTVAILVKQERFILMLAQEIYDEFGLHLMTYIIYYYISYTKQSFSYLPKMDV